MTLHFGKLHVKHPVLIVDKIAHKFILGNDFLTQYKCDLLNFAKAIVFGNVQVPYTLFRSTVNSICPVIYSTTTTIGPYEEMVLPALLDANAHYSTNQNLLLKPTTSKASPILKARVVVNYTSVVVPLLIANISSAPVTTEKGEILAVDQPLEQHSFSEEHAERHGNKTTPVQEACDRSDPALTREQTSGLFAVLNKQRSVFSQRGRSRAHKSYLSHDRHRRQWSCASRHEANSSQANRSAQSRGGQTAKRSYGGALVFTFREPLYIGQKEGWNLASLY